MRRGGNGLIFGVSESTLRRLHNELGISFVTPQTTITARINAEDDVRNFFVEAVMEAAFMSACDVNLILNMDATTFAIYGTGLALSVAIIRQKEDKEPVTVVPAASTLGLYVKVYNMISMGLSAAPSVLILADDTMGPEEFLYFRVEKLSHESGAQAYGWITLCRTRQGNDAFYKWYYKTVAVISILLSILFSCYLSFPTSEIFVLTHTSLKNLLRSCP